MSQDHTRLPPTRGEGQGLPVDVGADLDFIGAALSWYDGSPAGRDVQSAWKRVRAALGLAAEALEPFAKDAEGISPWWDDKRRRASISGGTTLADVRKAARAYSALRFGAPSAAGQSLTEASVYGSSPLINEAHPPGGNSHEG